MRAKGSMTVFAALLFMLVASFLFALLEAARVQMLQLYADMTSELAVESVFAEYQSDLWTDYQLLCLNGAYGERVFSEEYLASVLGTRIRKNLDTKGAGSRIMELEYISSIPNEYQFLTDGEGDVFLHCVSERMKESIPLSAAQELYKHYLGGRVLEEGKDKGDSVLDAWNIIEEARAQRKDENMPSRDLKTTEILKERMLNEGIELRENPLEIVLACKQKFLLGMVLEDVGSLSVKAIEKEECLENRDILKGTKSQMPKVGWYDRILAMEYADAHFADYSEAQKERALEYELEYVICGKKSDRENLEVVVKRLLTAREVANVIHIMLNQQKRIAVSEMAMTLAGFTANPAIIKAAEYGVISAWAYAESILDVRALLCGDRIALIKSEKEWTSNLINLAQILDGGLRARECKEGWNYQDYLKAFLFTMAEKNLAYRMMDVMEQNLHQTNIYRNCRMDHMLSEITYTITYQMTPLFWEFLVLKSGTIGSLQYQNTKKISYY